MRDYKGPVFQHRHYAEIAACIAKTRTREELIDAMAATFARDNGRFDRGRFDAAARGEAIKNKDKR